MHNETVRLCRTRLAHAPALFALLTLTFAGALLLSPSSLGAQAQILAAHEPPVPDFDSRTASLKPTSGQKAIVSGLGATARWNRFGTPQSLIKHGGFLASGLQADPVLAAKGWIRANKALFRLSDQGVNNLELLSDSRMAGSSAHAVLFRQTFGGLPAAHDGVITVGIVKGKIAYVSSSAAGDGNAPAPPKLSPKQAWLRAAADLGIAASLGSLSKTRTDNSWTVFDAAGLVLPQRARLVAFPTVERGVRPAFETIVLDNQDGRSIAYTYFIDAETGGVLLRLNRVDRLAAVLAPQSFTFTGTYAPSTCGPAPGLAHGPYQAPPGTTSIEVLASAAIVANDIVIKLDYLTPGNEVASQDLLTSPEVLVYEPAGGVPPGEYFVRICPFAPPQNDDELYNYAGTITINDTPDVADPFPPKWNFFEANPPLNPVLGFPWGNSSNDTRILGCWLSVVEGNPIPGCDLQLANLAARFPWDLDTRTNAPTFTTLGNAANTSRAWLSPLTPDVPYKPVAADREYDFPWTNEWFEKRCDRTVFAPDPGETSGNDADAAIVNLFSEHNRIHDWSYFLGFTEVNSNAQDNNFGNTSPPGPFPAGRERDPEIGDVQAGALTAGAPTFIGRDNANQITLNDGVPPITNMYLWQPIAGAFYAPCVDGDYDQAVIGHEYTHLISNRMVGGPDNNLSGPQAGAMGESWSDLNSVEYLNEYKFVPTNGENPFSVGAYVTGNKERAIRNYNMSRNLAPPDAIPAPPQLERLNTTNPLNYSDIGYGFGGAQVHDDGEIWSATNFEIRKALIQKYNASFPASNGAMQRECADGVRPSYLCPGNRRWIQIVYDAWLMMPGNVSFLDARDAYLAADAMRATDTPSGGWPSNQKELWRAFAHRGMGWDAVSATNADADPIPSFESNPPLESEKVVNFQVFAADEGNAPITNARIFVGHFEARATPIADTDPVTSDVTDTAEFVTGSYDFVVQAKGYGHLRFPRFFTPGGALTLKIYMSTNRASLVKGAAVVPTGSTGARQNDLFDDTENTNWVGGTPVNVQQVTVDLQGDVQNVKRVNVSAMLNPTPASAPGGSGGGRFTALREFEIWACNATTAAGGCLLATDTDFTKIYSSPANAFPAVVPRPGPADLLLRGFDVTDTQATHIRLKVVTNQCTAGTPAGNGPNETGYRGDQDDDVLNVTDCVLGSSADITVRAAELQVFGSTPALPPRDPAVLLVMTAPVTVKAGGNIVYDISYTNAGPATASNARLTDVLPAGVAFASATGGGAYDKASRTVTWNLGSVPVQSTGTAKLTVRVLPGTSAGTVIANEAEFTADLTIATPAVAATTVVP